MAGTLYVVATPIGNLEDLTFRARRILGEADLIAAEDTRRTAKLLAHYGIRRPLSSLHEHNEYREAPRLVARLAAGESIALVSDAGTPGVADPGASLVRLARERGIGVVPIPGPSAVSAALSVSGLSASHYVFRGFPPPKGLARTRWFDAVSQDASIQVLFESPHRIRRTLSELTKCCGIRPIYVFREITKINEEYVICNNIYDACDIKAMGEFTLVVSPLPESPSSIGHSTLNDAVELAMAITTGVDDEKAVAISAKLLDVDQKTLTTAIKRHKISVKQQMSKSP